MHTHTHRCMHSRETTQSRSGTGMHTHPHTHTPVPLSPSPVPKGEGAGTLESWNGSRAAELLFQLDASSLESRPLSWLLIRPPWSSSVSNKVCAYHKMTQSCLNQSKEKEEGEEQVRK